MFPHTGPTESEIARNSNKAQATLIEMMERCRAEVRLEHEAEIEHHRMRHRREYRESLEKAEKNMKQTMEKYKTKCREELQAQIKRSNMNATDAVRKERENGLRHREETIAYVSKQIVEPHYNAVTKTIESTHGPMPPSGRALLDNNKEMTRLLVSLDSHMRTAMELLRKSKAYKRN